MKRQVYFQPQCRVVKLAAYCGDSQLLDGTALQGSDDDDTVGDGDDWLGSRKYFDFDWE